MTNTTFWQAVMLIQSDYVEMGDMRLTLAQAARLWALPVETCRAAIDALVITGFLVMTPGGAYARRGTAPVTVASVDPLTWAVSPQGISC